MMALFASFFFALHFVHVEPVIWLSASADIFLGLFAILFFLGLKQERFIMALVSSILAILAKETGVFLVVLIFFFWKGRRTALLLIPFLLFLVLRIPAILAETGDSYSLRMGLNIFRNLGFFLSAMFFPLDYRAISDMPGTPLPAILAVLLGGVVCAILLVNRESRRMAIFSILLFLPFLFISGSGYRYLYLPSIFLSIALAQALKGKIVFIIPVSMLFFTVHTTLDWKKAATITESTSRYIEKSTCDCFSPENAPDSKGSAYVFRNGLTALIEIHGKRSEKGCTQLFAP